MPNSTYNQGLLLTLFPNTCSLISPVTSFASWLNLDSVLTLFALRQPLRITGLTQVAIVARQMTISRMSNMPSSIVHHPRWSLFAWNMPTYSLRQNLLMCAFFKSKQQSSSSFLHILLAFYEQASGTFSFFPMSSHTSWLKALSLWSLQSPQPYLNFTFTKVKNNRYLCLYSCGFGIDHFLYQGWIACWGIRSSGQAQSIMKFA